jgi:outer membrane receptor protein involved in Fe transport
MKIKRGIYTAVVTALSTGAATGVAVAQDAVLEEVVVTARRYAESITDAPVAVNVMSGDYLREQGVNNVYDIIELTPGASWGEFAKAQPAIIMRGINAANLGNASLESAAQLVVDGIPQTKAFMMTPPVYDLERVEVMRGPQGTTFGRNATLGIMHFITAKPSQEFDAAINTQAGTRGLLGLDGFINGGLTDEISVRLAFNKKQSDGDMENEITGAAIDGWDNTSIRASLLFEPNDSFSAYLKGEYVLDDNLPNARRSASCNTPWLTSGPYIEEYTGNCDPWKMQQSEDPPGGFFTRRNMTFLTAELAWQLDNDLTVTSLTGLQDGRHHTYMDVFGTPRVLQDQEVRNEGSVFSTELRLDNSASGDPLRWLAGIYLQSDSEDRLEYNRGFPERGSGGGRIVAQPPSHWITTSTGETTSVGLFGELSFDLSDRLNLTVGGRYSDDSRDYLFSNECSGRAGACTGFGLVDPVYGGNPAYDCANPANRFVGPSGIVECGTLANPMGIVDPESISRGWDNFSGKVSLSFAVNDNNNVYALYSEGFKAGGFQHDARNIKALRGTVVEPETAENFELGWKGSYDRARFAVTWFSMEQINAQSSALIPVGSTFTTSVVNFGGIEMEGMEFEGTFLLGDNFMLGGNFAVYDGVLGPGSFTNASFDPDTGQAIGTDVSGQPTGLEETYVLFGEYDFNLGSGATITLRADIQHRSAIPGPPNRANNLTLDGDRNAFERPEIDNVGASVTWTSASGNTQVSLWGKNLKDEYDWKNIGPPIGFHYAVPGGMGPGEAGRGYSGREQVGLDARFNF